MNAIANSNNVVNNKMQPESKQAIADSFLLLGSMTARSYPSVLILDIIPVREKYNANNPKFSGVNIRVMKGADPITIICERILPLVNVATCRIKTLVVEFFMPTF